MADTKSKKPVGRPTDDKGVRMYPSNSLPKQLRSPHENLRALTVLREAFGTR